MKKIIIGTLLTCALATAGGDITAVEEQIVAPVVTEESSAWEQRLVIYGWLPTFDGQLTFDIPDELGGGEGESDGSLIDSLDATFMAAYEVRKDKWSFLADMIYLQMSGGETIVDRNRVQFDVDEEFTAWIVSGYAGYNLIDNGSTTLDIIGGVRYFSFDLEGTLTLDVGRFDSKSATINPSFEVYDAVVGVKGKYDINENWYIPYLFDIGAGDTDLTWNAEASIGYRFGWGDVMATYRYLHYEKDDLRLVEDFDLYGPKVGVVFHF